MEQRLITIGSLQKIRAETSLLLPVGHSFIPFDILITAYCGDEHGQDLTVKALFANLPYSDMGIRYHFKKLISTGWLELHNGDKDTRIKRVKASSKLVKRLQLLEERILPVFKSLQT